MFEQFTIHTPAHAALVDVTAQVRRLVSQSGIQEGMCHLWVPHTTAGLTVNENADPTVRSDMLKTLDRLLPWRDDYEHDEGNSAAHIKASLMGFGQSLIIVGGQLRLGVWQGIYLAEFDGPRTRQVWVKIVAG